MGAGLALGTALPGCSFIGGGVWPVTLIDGEQGLENFTPLGDANWQAQAGTIMADQGKGGFLVSRDSYRDFLLIAEFWAEDRHQLRHLLASVRRGRDHREQCIRGQRLGHPSRSHLRDGRDRQLRQGAGARSFGRAVGGTRWRSRPVARGSA
jgi:hypothetical protein